MNPAPLHGLGKIVEEGSCVVLPNFIGIGAARAGSTWIFRNLKSHPQVFVCKCKETQFFSHEYSQGIEHYETHFEGADGARAIGEVSPVYLHEARAVAPRIHRHLPNVKLIACLRNPVDRLYSKYWNARGRYAHRQNLPFERKLAEQPELLREGRYAEHLATYLELFPREQILVLLYDDLVADPERFFMSICRFLEIDEHYEPALAEHRINAAVSQPLVVKNRWLYWGGKALRRLDMNAAARWVEVHNAGKIPPLPTSTRRWLTETYYGPNKQLETLLGRDLSHWNS
jgi:hypothetical protein